MKNKIKIGSLVLGLSLFFASPLWAQSERPILAIKNFREILYSLEAITGVPSSDREVQQTYRFTVDRLPLNGTPSEMSSPMVLGLTELTGVFCSKLVAQEVALEPVRRKIFKRHDFSKNFDQLTMTEKRRLLTTLGEHFWQRELTSPEMDQLLDSVEPLESTGQVGALTLCTIFLSSLEFLVI